jgi:arylsulfatase A-like enzyme
VRNLILYPVDLEALAGDPEAAAGLRRRLAAIAGPLRRDLPLRESLAGWLTGVRDLRYPLAAYAGEVAYVDDAIGRLRAALEELGVAGRTIVVVTADHGESLGEHGVWFNHFGLTEPNLRVPLVVWAPGRVPPAHHDTPTDGLDLAPTILQLAGLPIPPAMQGRDLLAADAPRAPLVQEMMRGWQVALRDGPWKYVRTLTSFYYVDDFERSRGARELYRLDTDPGERENVVAAHPELAAVFDARLEAWLAAQRTPADGAAPAGPVSPSLEGELRALGYVQ